MVCCALPALLVLLGLGTTVAAVVSATPWLVALSRQKDWVFLAAGLLVAGSGFYMHRVPSPFATRFVALASPPASADGAACPLPLARATRAAWWTSVVVYALGFLVAYALGPLLAWLDG